MVWKKGNLPVTAEVQKREKRKISMVAVSKVRFARPFKPWGNLLIWLREPKEVSLN